MLLRAATRYTERMRCRMANPLCRQRGGGSARWRVSARRGRASHRGDADARGRPCAGARPRMGGPSVDACRRIVPLPMRMSIAHRCRDVGHSDIERVGFRIGFPAQRAKRGVRMNMSPVVAQAFAMHEPMPGRRPGWGCRVECGVFRAVRFDGLKKQSRHFRKSIFTNTHRRCGTAHAATHSPGGRIATRDMDPKRGRVSGALGTHACERRVGCCRSVSRRIGTYGVRGVQPDPRSDGRTFSGNRFPRGNLCVSKPCPAPPAAAVGSHAIHSRARGLPMG